MYQVIDESKKSYKGATIAAAIALAAAIAVLIVMLIQSNEDTLVLDETVAAQSQQPEIVVGNELPAEATVQQEVAEDEPETTAEAELEGVATASPEDVAANLALIRGNANTRNTLFDATEFLDVPMSQIRVADLSVSGDIYNDKEIASERDAYFRVECEVSHFAYDDPIVFPNQPGRAHLHMFFGNTEANAFSTFDSLMNTGTGTCNGADLNRTAYWVPALLDSGGNAILPWEVMVYYKNTNFNQDGANVTASTYPDDLRMIAGNGGASSPQTLLTGKLADGTESIKVVEFACAPAYAAANSQYQQTIPDCYSNGNYNQSLEMKIAFPSCWNGESLYESDQSHMAYPKGGFWQVDCPDSHQVKLPSVMYRLFFRVDDYGGSLTDLHLSSDLRNGELLPGGTTFHADWMGAWHPEAMQTWVQNCNNTPGNDCEIGLLSRSPAVSLVQRQLGYYQPGKRIAAEELAKLCPEKAFDPANPVVSVSHCKHS